MKNKEKTAATKEEFYQTVDQEFSFLISKYGYQQTISNSPFAIEYKCKDLCVRISPASYGFGVNFEFLVDGVILPLWPIMTKLADRKMASSEKPQLDEIREYAWRLACECQALLEGDTVLIGSIRDTVREQEKKFIEGQEQFFGIAEILFEVGQFQECVKHLQKSPYELPPEWIERLSYARRQSNPK